ncbi:hypothetical protein [Anaerocolumna aminovalerica]|nr:hypothetical protein [Anaerocolumna aminovalerica]
MPQFDRHKNRTVDIDFVTVENFKTFLIRSVLQLFLLQMEVLQEY